MAKRTAVRKKKAAKAPVRRAAATKTSQRRAAKKGARKAAGKKAARPRPAKRKSAAKVATRAAATARATARRPAKKAVVKARPVRKAARKVVAKPRVVARPATAKKTKKTTARKVMARKAAARAQVATKAVAAAAKAAPTPAKAPAAKAAARKPPGLDRERRTVGEPKMVPTPPSSLVPGHASAARSGADELRVKLASHTGSGPALTAGDVDADWGAAEAVGDEAPGGDNPTPDQDVVDEIGRALGVEYDDDEELQGGDEIAGRDRNRWELDPASSDDFDER